MSAPMIQPGYPYFSPCQISLYVGDIWIDDMADIQYEVRDEKLPVYGFADQYYRATLRGRTIVTGVLVINFRFKGYLSNAIYNATGGFLGSKRDRTVARAETDANAILDQTTGRFLVLFQGYAEAVYYAPGKSITVVGEVRGRHIERL